MNVEYFIQDPNKKQIVEDHIKNIDKLIQKSMKPADVPNTLMMTYKDAHLIPSEVIDLWRSKNKNLELNIYGDDECYDYLFQNFDKEIAKNFSILPNGPVKSDYFRVHYMYITGGFYVDASSIPVLSIEKYRCQNRITSISSAFSNNKDDEYSEICPMFFSCHPKHIALEIAIEIYKLLFQKFEYDYWTFSISKIFTFIYEKYPSIFYLPLKENIVKNQRSKDFISDKDSGKKIIIVRNFLYNRKYYPK